MRISDWSSDVCSSDLTEPVMRALTGDELSGFAEITDDMLVLGDMVDLPPPGDEQAAIAFVTAMTARDVLEPVGADRSEERRVGKECVSTCRSRWSPTE